MSSLIGAAFAAGTVAFVLSLSLRGEMGSRLRRFSAFCFIAALAPALACHVFSSMSSQATAGDLGGLVLFLLIASPIAYGVLLLRARLRGADRPRRTPARRRHGISLRDEDEP